MLLLLFQSDEEEEENKDDNVPPSDIDVKKGKLAKLFIKQQKQEVNDGDVETFYANDPSKL